MQVILFNFFKKGVAEDTVNKNKSTDPDGGVEIKKKKWFKHIATRLNNEHRSLGDSSPNCI